MPRRATGQLCENRSKLAGEVTSCGARFRYEGCRWYVTSTRRRAAKRCASWRSSSRMSEVASGTYCPTAAVCAWMRSPHLPVTTRETRYAAGRSYLGLPSIDDTTLGRLDVLPKCPELCAVHHEDAEVRPGSLGPVGAVGHDAAAPAFAVALLERHKDLVGDVVEIAARRVGLPDGDVEAEPRLDCWGERPPALGLRIDRRAKAVTPRLPRFAATR
jgi:hypothetical protein